MQYKFQISLQKHPILAGFVTFFLFLTLILLLAYQRYLIVDKSLNTEIVSESKIIEERISQLISHNRSSTQTLAYILENHGIPNDFESIAKQLMRANEFIDVVEIVEGGIITHVYPIKDNEVIGLDILKDKEGRSGAMATINKGGYYVSGPLNLEQGGIGIICRTPVFKDEVFWGFSAIITRLPTFLEATKIDTSTKSKFYYQFSQIKDESKVEQFFLPNSEFLKNSRTTQIEVPNGEWRIYVGSKKTLPYTQLYSLLLLGLSLSIISGLFVWYLASQPNTLKKIVAETTKRLKQEEKEHTFLLDNLKDGFVTLDKDLKISSINNCACIIMNKAEADLIGKDFRNEFQDSTDKRLTTALYKALQDQQIVIKELQFLSLSKWLEFAIYPTNSGLSIFINDATETINNTMFIRNSELLFRGLTSNAPVAIFKTDSKGECNYVNSEWLKYSGFEYREAMGDGWTNPIHPEDLSRIQMEWAQAVYSGKDFKADYRIIDKESNVTFLSTKASAIYNIDGKLTGYIGMSLDISDLKKSEMDLIHFQNKLNAAIRIAKIGYWNWDIKTDIIHWSDRLYDIYGVQKGSTIKLSTVESRVHPDDLAYHQNLVNDRIINKDNSPFEYRILREDGTIKYVKVQMEVVCNEENEATEFRGTVLDITDQKEAEALLKESQEKFSKAFHSSLIGMAIINTEQKIIEVNNTVANFFEKTREQLLGKSLSDLNLTRNSNDYNQENIDIIWGEVQKNGFVEKLEVDLTLISGSKRTFLVSMESIVLNGLPHILSIILDITIQKQAEEKIYASERKYRALIEQASDGIFITNSDLKLIHVNTSACKMLGYSEAELLNLSLPEITLNDPVDPQLIVGEQRPILSRKHERILIRKDGIFIDVEVNGSKLENGNYMAFIRDITERKIAEKQLLKSQSDLRHLTVHLQSVRENERQNISREIHDIFGQQMTSLKFDISWLSKANLKNKKVTDRIESMNSIADETIKAIRKISSELRPRILDDLGLNAAIEWYIQSYQKNTEMECVIESNIEGHTFDKTISITIFRILQESLTNIARHAKASTVQIKINFENGIFIMNITDDGIGMVKSIDSVNKTFGIIGMKERANMINGTLDIFSKEKKGTTIQLTVPILT